MYGGRTDDLKKSVCSVCFVLIFLLCLTVVLVSQPSYVFYGRISVPFLVVSDHWARGYIVAGNISICYQVGQVRQVFRFFR